MKRPTKRVQWVLLAAILLLAAFLRLGRLDLIEFKFDEATTARSALGIARDGQLPAVGMVSSRGPHNPALMSYVLAPAFILTRDPRLAAGLVAVLGVAAVGVTYWLGNSYFGWPVGALASVLFAASPWAVFLSRKTWAENLPLLSLAFVAAILAVVVRRKPWALPGVLAAAGCLVSLHLGGLAFFFIAAAVMVLFIRRVQLLPLVVGLLLVALILSPYIVFDARHDWQNMRAFARMSDAESVVDLQAIRTAAVVTGGLRFESLAGDRHADFLGRLPGLHWLDLWEIALLVAGLGWSMVRIVRARLRDRELAAGDAARLVLVCWFAVPVLLLTPRSAPLQPHSLSILYPVQHLFIAIFIVDAVAAIRGRLGPRWGTIAALGACALTVAIVGWQISLQQALLDYVDTNDTPGGYGAPARHAIRAARQAEDLVRPGDGPIVALLPGGDPRYDGMAAVFDVLLPAGSRLVDGRHALVLPNEPTVLLVAPESEPASHLLGKISPELPISVPTRTGSPDAYRFFRLDPNSRDLAYSDVGPEKPRWELGAVLLGYAHCGDVSPGSTVRWTLVFSPQAPPPADIDAHWFNHLVDGEGAKWGQADGVGYPTDQWRTGDQTVVWFDVAISPDAPPPPYVIRSGMYTYPQIVNLQLLDVAGNPTGQFVELGPIGSATAP